MTEKEIEELIYASAAGAAVRFLREDRESDPLLPQGLIEDAVRRQIVYISKLAFIFEEQLRAMIPNAYDHRNEEEDEDNEKTAAAE